MKQTLVLVDGSSYLFRAYHALPPLTNTSGHPTGAMYGVMNMLLKLTKEYVTPHLVVVFDTKGKTFRHDMFPAYKANRPEMPEELACQIAPLHEMIQALGLPLIAVPGVEADDVIGTLTKQAEAKGFDVVISTGDKDMAQLVNDNVTLVNTMSETTLDVMGVKEKFGVLPNRIIDYLTLIGDTVDNIPGVAKVGPKTAVKWLTQYDSLDGVLEHAADIKGKVGENLRAVLSELPLSKQLVTIDTQVTLPTTLDKLVMQDPDKAALSQLYQTYGFKNWLQQLSDEQQDEKKPSIEYECVTSIGRLDAWCELLQESGLFAFDTETTSLNFLDAKLVGISVAVDTSKAAYIPFGHTYPDAPQQLTEHVVLEKFKPILENANLQKIGHNLKYDLAVLKNYEIELQGIAYDSMLESYVANSTGSRHDMDTLSQKYLEHVTISYEAVAGKGAKQITFDQVPLEEAVPYAAEDASVTLQLHHYFYPLIAADKRLMHVLERIEMPLMPVIAKMERTGVLLDVALLQQHSEMLAGKLQSLTQQIHAEAETEFNIDSPKQLQKVLYEDLQLPILAKTPKGQPSTAESVLSELAHEHPFAAMIVDYRRLNKLKSTYTDKLPQMVHAKTGRIHASFHQAVTATGRLSSSDPNLQNIPIRTEEGRQIRRAFVVEPEHVMFAADYSQIELRIMAHISQDAGLLRAFQQDKDIHTETAAEIFAITPDEVSQDQRRSAKAINFGLIYGMSAFGLAKQLNISRQDADAYIETYFDRYPGVSEYMDATREKASADGFVETLLGRRLHLPDIHSSNRNRRMAAERTAINAPMQGTAADIIKLAMIQVDDWITQEAPGIKLLIQVHDELVFAVPETMKTLAEAKICEIMCQVIELSVPLKVGAGFGNNWEEAH